MCDGKSRPAVIMLGPNLFCCLKARDRFCLKNASDEWACVYFRVDIQKYFFATIVIGFGRVFQQMMNAPYNFTAF